MEAGVGASTTFLAVDDLTTGIQDVQGGLTGVLGSLKAVLQLVPLAVLAVWSGTRLVAVAALVLLPFMVGLSHAKRWVKRLHADARDEGANLLEATDEAIRHGELWASYGASEHAHGRVSRASHALTRRVASAVAFAAGLSGATEALGALALLLVVLGFHTQAGDGARLLTFAVAFFMAYKPLRELAEARIAWAKAAVAAERLGLREVSLSRDATEQAPSADVPPEVLSLDGVRLVRGRVGALDLRVEPGTIVVIRGATGIGKTTLLRTLLGFSRVRSGEIRHGATPLHPTHLAWVPQDAPIVRGTLGENVAFGGDGDVRAAMDAIGALDLYERLGDAQLGVGGRALSGGEQKQVAIARALATSRPILLLDEPTAGLDERAQAAVLAAVAKLRGKRTIILVTHRPEPMVIADAVVDLIATGADPRARAEDLGAP
jgi:ABC-type multidrug transport system fused ATPase/permease subunit